CAIADTPSTARHRVPRRVRNRCLARSTRSPVYLCGRRRPGGACLDAKRSINVYTLSQQAKNLYEEDIPLKATLSLAALGAGAAIALICCGASEAAAKNKGVACADLKTALEIPDTTITLTEELPAGANPSPVGTLPVPICRVVGVTLPSVKFEVWM